MNKPPKELELRRCPIRNPTFDIQCDLKWNHDVPCSFVVHPDEHRGTDYSHQVDAMSYALTGMTGKVNSLINRRNARICETCTRPVALGEGHCPQCRHAMLTGTPLDDAEQQAWDAYAGGTKTLKEAVSAAFKQVGEAVLRDIIAAIIIKCINGQPETHAEELSRKLKEREPVVHGEKDCLEAWEGN